MSAYLLAHGIHNPGAVILAMVVGHEIDLHHGEDHDDDDDGHNPEISDDPEELHDDDWFILHVDSR